MDNPFGMNDLELWLFYVAMAFMLIIVPMYLAASRKFKQDAAGGVLPVYSDGMVLIGKLIQKINEDKLPYYELVDEPGRRFLTVESARDYLQGGTHA